MTGTRIAAIAWLILALGCGGVESAELVSTSDGFESPESALFDAARQSWFVSSMAGSTPGDGFISRLGPNGEILDRVFVGGLDDPKGQRIDGHTLYVTDNTRLVAIDLRDPSAIERIDVPGSTFLNDIAIDPSTHDVYVSDTFANAIFRVSKGVPSLVLQDAALEAPNGLLFEHGSLLIATIGPDLDPSTFATSAPGRVLWLDLSTLALTPLTARIGALDGIERDSTGLLVSDTFVGVDHIALDGSVDSLVNDAEVGLAASADIGYDPVRHRIGVPELGGTRVAFFDVHRSRAPR